MLPSILGMHYSSAHLERRAKEVEERNEHYGVIQSAQFLAGQITELALELAFETDKPSEIADEAHWLDILFKNLRNVETKASKIIGRGAFNSKNSHQFRDGRRQKKSSYPAKTTLFCSDTWQRGQPAFEVQPQLLRSRDNHRGVRWLSFLGIFKPHI